MGRMDFDHLIACRSGFECALTKQLDHIVNFFSGDGSGLAISRAIAEILLNIRGRHTLVDGLAADVPELDGGLGSMSMDGVDQIGVSGKVAIVADIQ